ncbi:MAG TPA: class I SAM-dependent methyltransferase [Pseudonocardia sp.]
MDATTAELRQAHDAIAELYADRLADALDRTPADRAVLGLFCDLLFEQNDGTAVGDIGSGSGRLARFLVERGVQPHGIDLSPEMVRVARRDYPGIPFDVADMRDLPFADASLAGVVCWYSLMYLAPAQRPRAFSELARVVRPGGYLATAFKLGDDRLRRGGQRVGVAFDIYWLSLAEMERAVTAAGLHVVFSATRPAGPDEDQPQGYVVARRPTAE